VNTLEQIAQRHLDADLSWADEAMMLAALRESAEQCAKIVERGEGQIGWEQGRRLSAAAIRKWAEGKP